MGAGDPPGPSVTPPQNKGSPSLGTGPSQQDTADSYSGRFPSHLGCPRGNPSCPSSLPPAPRCTPGSLGTNHKGPARRVPSCRMVNPGKEAQRIHLVLVTSLSHPAWAPRCDPALSSQNHSQAALSPSGQNQTTLPASSFPLIFFNPRCLKRGVETHVECTSFGRGPSPHGRGLWSPEHNLGVCSASPKSLAPPRFDPAPTFRAACLI